MGDLKYFLPITEGSKSTTLKIKCIKKKWINILLLANTKVVGVLLSLCMACAVAYSAKSRARPLVRQYRSTSF